MSDSLKTIHQNGMNFAPSTSIIRSGFIAQEVDSVAKLCGFTTDIVHTPADGNDNYSIAYGVLVVPLVKAVQQLSATVDSLKATPSAKKAAQNNDSLMQEIEQLKALVNKCCSANPANQTGDNTDRIGNPISVELKSADNVLLYQNIPNPFGDETTINYYLSETVQNAKMFFYDNMGRVIKEVLLEEKGNASVVVSSAKLATGIYSYSIVIDGKVIDTMKMQRVK